MSLWALLFLDTDWKGKEEEDEVERGNGCLEVEDAEELLDSDMMWWDEEVGRAGGGGVPSSSDVFNWLILSNCVVSIFFFFFFFFFPFLFVCLWSSGCNLKGPLASGEGVPEYRIFVAGCLVCRKIWGQYWIDSRYIHRNSVIVSLVVKTRLQNDYR